MRSLSALSHASRAAIALVLAATTAEAQAAKPLLKCPIDSVPSGSVCMDKYEASVWRVPNPTRENRALVTRIRKGTAKQKDLLRAGATQLGLNNPSGYPPCLGDGSGCTDVFAVSLPGIYPSALLGWFTAAAACRNSAKRLPTNAEWQAAVAGTPDPGSDNGTTDCNTNGGATLTGGRTSCVSTAGAFDMVGNKDEIVANWVVRGGSTDLGSWTASVSPTADDQLLVGSAGEPAEILRGGSRFSGTGGGPMALIEAPLGLGDFNIGFRCAR